MTDAERALWKQAQADYKHALLIAADTLAEQFELAKIPETVQAAAATILIHITKLRQEVPRSAAPAAVKRDDTQSAPSQAPVAVPPCPQCGGEMWDNRGKKKNPKSADFTCKQKNGECVNDKGFKTGVWVKDLKKPVTAGNIRDGIDSYAEMPATLQDTEDALPF